MAKNSIEAYGAEGKTNLLQFDPANLTLITDKKHELYDPRVNDPIDAELVASIKMKGVVEPIIVWKDPETGLTCVVDGRGRTKANVEANKQLVAENLPIKLINAVVGKGDARTVMATMVLANEGRREPTATGRGAMARRLLDQGYTEAQTAVLLHCSRPTLTNYLSLAGATAAVREAVDSKKIGPTQGYELAKLEPAKQRETLTAMLTAAEGETGKRKRSKKMRAASGKTVRPSVNELKEFHTEVSDVGTESHYRDTVLAVLDWVLGKGKRPSATKAKRAA